MCPIRAKGEPERLPAKPLFQPRDAFISNTSVKAKDLCCECNCFALIANHSPQDQSCLSRSHCHQPMDQCCWAYQRTDWYLRVYLNFVVATLRTEPHRCKTSWRPNLWRQNTFHHLSKAWWCLAVLEWINLPRSPLTTYTQITHKCVKMELHSNLFSIIVCWLSARGWSSNRGLFFHWLLEKRLVGTFSQLRESKNWSENWTPLTHKCVENYANCTSRMTERRVAELAKHTENFSTWNSENELLASNFPASQREQEATWPRPAIFGGLVGPSFWGAG